MRCDHHIFSLSSVAMMELRVLIASSLIYSFSHPSTRSLIHLLTHSSTHPLTYSPIRTLSTNHSFTHPSIHYSHFSFRPVHPARQTWKHSVAKCLVSFSTGRKNGRWWLERLSKRLNRLNVITLPSKLSVFPGAVCFSREYLERIGWRDARWMDSSDRVNWWIADIAEFWMLLDEFLDEAEWMKFTWTLVNLLIDFVNSF